MFTSMRNVLSKEEPASKIDSNPPKNPEEDGRKEVATKQALTRVKALKRDQGKLKTEIENEFTSIKNYFYQLEEVMHTYESPAIETPPPSQSDP